MPELMVDVCRVGNESLAVLVYSVLIYAAFKFLDNPGRLRSAALLGVTMGLGLLTKAYFLTALPALVAILACCFCFEPRLRRWILYRGLPAVAVALFLSGWWYWRNRALTGSWSGVMPDVALGNMPLWELLRRIPRVEWKRALDALLFSHIWFGNWSFLQVRSWIYRAFEYALLLSLIGLFLVSVSWLKRSARFLFLSSPRYMLVLLTFYLFFWLGLLYHILITFVAQGISASQGWYLYCLVVAEVTVIVAGLLAVSPARLRPWVLPASSIGFVLLDLYTVHFLFIPYYIGLITHKAGGALAAFRVAQIPGLDLWEYVGRLAVHMPLLNPAGFLVIWACYLIATLGLAAISLRLGRQLARNLSSGASGLKSHHQGAKSKSGA
jgi:hypothetical protein